MTGRHPRRMGIAMALGLATALLPLACRGTSHFPSAGAPELDRQIVIRHDYSIPRTVRASRDSAWAVREAEKALQDEPADTAGFVVVTFVGDRDGFLIRLAIDAQTVIGGGGLVWVDRTGTVVVLHRYQ